MDLEEIIKISLDYDINSDRQCSLEEILKTTLKNYRKTYVHYTTPSIKNRRRKLYIKNLEKKNMLASIKTRYEEKYETGFAIEMDTLGSLISELTSCRPEYFG